MHVDFVLTQDAQRDLKELAEMKGVDPEALNYVLAFFGYRKELAAQLKRARERAADTKKNGEAPAPITWNTVDKPARGEPTPIDWASAMAAIDSGEIVV